MLCFDEKNRAYLRAHRKSNYDKSKLLCFDEKNRVYLQAHRNSNHEKSNSCVLTRKIERICARTGSQIMRNQTTVF